MELRIDSFSFGFPPKKSALSGANRFVNSHPLTIHVIKARRKHASIALLMDELKTEHLQRAFSNVNKQYAKRLFKYSAHKTPSTFTCHAFTMLMGNELSK